MRTITVLVVNDQTLERLGLRLLIEAQPDIAIVGETADSAEAVRAAAGLHPDVVLIDMGTPSDNTLRDIRLIARPDNAVPATRPERADGPARILVLAGPDVEEHAGAVLRAGAAGFLNRDALPDQLTAAIRNVAHGGAVLSSRLARQLIDVVRAQPQAGHPERRVRIPCLTEREHEVLTALAFGWNNIEMAERLSIAPTTVKAHVSSILTKLAVRTRAQAVVYAYERGLVRTPRTAASPTDK